MASGLQCPLCSHVHAVAEVGESERFRCRGCNKLLSVPAVPAAAGAARAAGAATSGGTAFDATAAVPRAEPPDSAVDRPVPAPPPTTGPPMRPAAPRRIRPLPAALRAFVWLLALPIGFVAAAVPLRAVGVLDLDDAINAFANTGFGRFRVLLVLLPLWAGITAGLAHLVLEYGARLRNRKVLPGRVAPVEPAAGTARPGRHQARQD